MFGTSGRGIRSIQKVAQWDSDFSCVGIIQQSEPGDQSTVSEERPLELFQERSDTYTGSTPILAAHKSRGVALDPSSLLTSPTRCGSHIEPTLIWSEQGHNKPGL